MLPVPELGKVQGENWCRIISNLGLYLQGQEKNTPLSFTTWRHPRRKMCLHTAQEGRGKPEMLSFHTDKLLPLERAAGLCKSVLASWPSGMYYPSAIKVYKFTSYTLCFWEFSRFQCPSVEVLAHKIATACLLVILHCFVYIMLQQSVWKLSVLSRKGKLG